MTGTARAADPRRGAARERIAVWPLLRGLWRAMTRRRRRDFARAAGLTAACVAAELAMLETLRRLLAAAIVPATNSADVGWLAALATGGGDTALLLLPLVLFLACALALTAFRLLSLRSNDRLVLSLAGDIGVRLFRGAVRQPLAAHQQQETAELFAGLDKTQQLTNGALGPLLLAVSNATVALAMIAYLVWIAPLLTLLGGTLLTALYALIGRITRPQLQRSSQTVARLSSARMKFAHEAQGGFRDLVLNQAQARAEREFAAVETAYRRSQAESRFVAGAPRHVIELALLTLVGVVAIYLTRTQTGVAALVPLAGTLAVGAQRLVPMINGAHAAWGQFLGSSALLSDVLELVGRPVLPVPAPGSAALPFERELRLEGVGLCYPDRDWVFRGLDLCVARGERIGIMGATGVGKSSLLDVLLGLVEPSEGAMRIDGRVLDEAARARWQATVALVPQTIYLPDRELRELIAFPHEPDVIDPQRLAAAVAAAQLEEFIAALPHGLATRVGDRGVRLSGGQRQRIALARAFYRRPAVLILDEATGQLDRDTERRVIAALSGLDAGTTLIVVSHRESAFAGCDRVLQLHEGQLRPAESETRDAST